jgi:hypothetical protein
MALKFGTYIELGEELKRRKPELADQDSESLGIRFTEKHGEKYDVQIDEEVDRSTFKYQPDEGFSVLKTLGNIPASAKFMAQDVYRAATSPLQTGEALARGAAGGVEKAIGTDFYPENKAIAEQMYEGLAQSVTPRGIQERPLDFLSTLAGGAGVGAKAVSTAGRLAGRAAKAAGAADAASKIGQVATAAEKAGKAAQILDPMVAAPRAVTGATKTAAKETAKAAGRAVVGGAKKIGDRIVVQPIRSRLQDANVSQTVDDLGQAVMGFAEMAGPKFKEKFADAMGGDTKGFYEQTKASALDKIRRLKKYGEGKATEGMDVISEGQAGPVTGQGVLDGMVANWMGFSTGLGSQLINKIVDLSKLNDQSARKLMLEAANRKYDKTSKYNTVGDEILTELTEVVDEFVKKGEERTLAIRDDLNMGKIKANIPALRQSIVQNPELLKEGVVFDFGTVKDDIGYGPVGGRVFQERPATPQDKGFRPDKVDISATDVPKVDPKYVGSVNEAFNFVFNLKDNATIRDLDVAKRKIDKLLKTSEGMAAQQLGALRKAVYNAIQKRYDDPDVRQALGVADDATNPYINAMAEYEQFVQTIDDIESTLKVKNPQEKFGGTELRVLRQTAAPQTVVKSVLNAFGENDREIAMRNLDELLRETKNKTLMPKIVGFAMRPVFGEGLIVKSEISAGVRGLIGYNMLNALSAPLVLGTFSPKFGGMALSYLYSPEGNKVLRSLPGRGEKYVGETAQSFVGKMGSVPGLRKLTGERTGKSANKVTPAEMQETVSSLQKIQDIVNTRLDNEQVTALKSFSRAGVATERAQEQEFLADERKNILSTLGQTQR